jgi:hypothetical protein
VSVKITDKKARSGKAVSEINIPLCVFDDREFSFMESVVFYMKTELGLTYHEIAASLNRDDRTIWTVYKRAAKKKEAK